MAKRKIRWTAEATVSLLDILEYFVKRNKSKTYSRKLRNEIKKSISFLSRQPYLGKETEVEGIRELNHEIYQIYYFVDLKEVSILLIWDGRRNPNDLRKFLESL